MKAQLVVLLLGALCLPSLAQNLPPSCGPEKQAVDVRTAKNHHPTIPLAPGTATLVFIQRSPVCIGCGEVRIGVDGSWVGANKGDSYFSVSVAPGERHVCAYWSSTFSVLEDKLWLTDVSARMAQTYYYYADFFGNTARGGLTLRLEPISPDEANFLISNSSLASSTPGKP